MIKMKTTNITLCISGYRYFTDYKKIVRSMDIFIEKYGLPHTMYFGECSGTDKLALRYVIENSDKIFDYKIFYADWKKYGLRAGPIRNEEMIKISTHLLAFEHENSKGTKNAISLAKKYKLNVMIIDI